jgi:glucose/mannose-6-phosphate isomerase
LGDPRDEASDPRDEAADPRDKASDPRDEAAVHASATTPTTKATILDEAAVHASATTPTPKATILDDTAAMLRADPSDMLAAVAGFPAQVEEGWRISRAIELPWERPRSVALLGMGGSAIGGDLVRGIWSDRLTAPMEVVRGYDLPAWVGQDTLVVASSYSGATEETISAFGAALERRCPVAVISTGGPLGEVARRAGLPLVTFDGAGSPRASVGYSMAILAGLLERVGVLELDGSEIDAAVETARGMVARCDPGVATSDNPAKRLAWSLVDRLVVVAASGALAPVARRWKAQINENGKSAAVVEELPEATHNTVVGFEQPDSVRDHLFVVFLTAASDHPRNAMRAALIAELLESGHIAHDVVRVDGDGRLAQALSAIVLGDYVSVYLAFMYGIDPTPVDVIDHIKARLADGPSGQGR